MCVCKACAYMCMVWCSSHPHRQSYMYPPPHTHPHAISGIKPPCHPTHTHTCIVDVSWLGFWGGIIVGVSMCVCVCVLIDLCAWVRVCVWVCTHGSVVVCVGVWVLV